MRSLQALKTSRRSRKKSIRSLRSTREICSLTRCITNIMEKFLRSLFSSLGSQLLCGMNLILNICYRNFTAKLLNKINFPPDCVAADGTKYYSDIWHGVAFILLSGIFSELMAYSEDLYTNFIIKERHGFNKMTVGVYISDKIKEYILTAVIGLPIYYGFMWLVIWGGEKFYIYVSIFMAVTIILMVNLVPNVIMPLFNKYEDL